MGYDRDAKKVVLKTCSGRLATIPVLDPDLTRHLPEESAYSIPTRSNVNTYVALTMI
jgi:hypothetical protein